MSEDLQVVFICRSAGLRHTSRPQVPEDRNLISNQIHTLPLFTYVRSISILSSSLSADLTGLSYLQNFRHKNYTLLHFLTLPLHATCSVHLIILDLAILTSGYKSWNHSLCDLLFPVIFPSSCIMSSSGTCCLVASLCVVSFVCDLVSQRHWCRVKTLGRVVSTATETSVTISQTARRNMPVCLSVCRQHTERQNFWTEWQ
jgi:hypothetical protein